MTGAGWWRLLNPIDTTAPPHRGSRPELVLGADTLLLNDDWRETARTGVIGIGTTDGLRTEVVRLDVLRPAGADDDYLIVLAHPTRLWVRTVDGLPPALGAWVLDNPRAAVAAAETRRGGKLRRATDRGRR